MTTVFTVTPIPQPYISPHPDHAFRFRGSGAKCTCGWKLWGVRKDLACRSHLKHLNKIQQDQERKGE